MRAVSPTCCPNCGVTMPGSSSRWRGRHGQIPPPTAIPRGLAPAQKAPRRFHRGVIGLCTCAGPGQQVRRARGGRLQCYCATARPPTRGRWLVHTATNRPVVLWSSWANRPTCCTGPQWPIHSGPPALDRTEKACAPHDHAARLRNVCCHVR